jgi:hypothetical protein
MPITIPLVIRALNERLRFRYNSPQRAARLDTFTVDLSDWKLSLTDKTPCFWIHTPEQFEQGAIDLAEEIRDAVRQKHGRTSRTSFWWTVPQMNCATS